MVQFGNSLRKRTMITIDVAFAVAGDGSWLEEGARQQLLYMLSEREVRVQQ